MKLVIVILALVTGLAVADPMAAPQDVPPPSCLVSQHVAPQGTFFQLDPNN